MLKAKAKWYCIFLCFWKRRVTLCFVTSFWANRIGKILGLPGSQLNEENPRLYPKSHSHLTIPWCIPTDGRLLLLIPLMDIFLTFQLSSSITQRKFHWHIFSESVPRFLVSGFMWIVILGTSQSTAGSFRRRGKKAQKYRKRKTLVAI